MDFAEWKKKKEKDTITFAEWRNQQNGADSKQQLTESDYAPVKQTTKDTEERTWFQKGAFEDGYQFGDLTKTIGGTVSDLRAGLMSGVLGIGEKVVDAGAYVVGLFGNDEFKDKTKEFIAKDLYDERAVAEKIIKGTTPSYGGTYDNLENSVLGEKSDALVESGGQLLGQIGLQAVGVPWFVTSGVTSFGSETESAFNQGASYGEAGWSGLITAGAEILTEKISGGIKFGGKTLDDALTKKLATGISNKFLRTGLKLGLDAVGEGYEEVLSENIGRFGQWLTYQDDKTLSEMLWSEEAMEAKIEAFLGGAALGGVSSGFKAVDSAVKGRDATTGLTANEEAVFKKVYEDAIAKAEEGGKELTKKQKSELYDNVMEALKKGDISTDTIEAALGGEAYDAYKKTADVADSFKQKKEALQKEFDELNKMKVGERTGEQTDRLEELRGQIKDLDKRMNRYNRNHGQEKDVLKSKLSEEVQKQLIHKDANGKAKYADNYLIESYNESARRGQKFEADLTKYKDKQQEIVKKAVESGILNNTRRTHELVDWISKIAADKGISFDFLNNEKLKASSYAIDGKTVNGYYDSKTKTIGVNIDGKRYLDTVVGHEVAHVLEGTEVYTELQKALFKYAESKGEYDSRRKALESLYKEEDIDSELTADLVGDYLFTDADFIKNLSANHRNVFQKLFDEIKYLCKVATAGSKEAKELERVKKLFEEAYRENIKGEGKNEIDSTKVAFSLDKNWENGYNLYTATDDFIRQVPDGSRHDFARSLAHKTSGMTEGETKVVHIYAGNIYAFRADGYMHGEMVGIVAPSELKERIATRKEYKNGTDTDRKTSDLWFEPNRFTGRGSGGDISVPEGRGRSDFNDTLSEDSSEGFTARYTERERQNFESKEEVDEVVKNLREMYGFDAKKSNETFAEDQSNDIAPVKTSSTDGVFSDGKKTNGSTKFSLSESDGKQSMREQAEYNGKDFWLAVADLNGNIVKTWTYAEAEAIGFDADYEVLFDEKLKDGYRFFTTDLIEDNGRIEFDDFGEPLPDNMIERINEQIKIKPATNPTADIDAKTLMAHLNESLRFSDSGRLYNDARSWVEGEGVTSVAEDLLLEHGTEYGSNIPAHQWVDALYESGLDEAEVLKRVEFAISEAFNGSTKPTGDSDVRYSLSSIANTFFGDENMSAYAFQQADYKQTQGYKDYVEQCVNNYRQTRTDFDEVTTRKEIEDSIDGIIQVAVASKKAGYDIYDDATKRNKKDSKNRLLFSSLEPNSDYFTSSDISTICDKRQNFAEIYDDIVRAEEAKGVPKGKRFFDNVDNYFYLHNLMADKGLTQPCRQCYVESMRKNLAPMANAFIRLVGETDPNNTANDQLYEQKGKKKGEMKSNNAATREWVREKLAEYDMTAESLTVEMLTTEDGLAQLKIQAPLIYEAFNSFYGQSKPKMPKSATPFRFGELTALLTDNKGKIKQSLVNKINSTGGFRLQSYSDFQIQNYTDVLQVIFEAGTLGLNGHAYTKVPAFLDATEGTNLKRNISIFMYKDGNEWKLDRNDSFPYSLDEIYDIINSDETGNTSIIAVSQNNEMSAWIMANDNVGYGIPFHKSGMKMGTVRETIVKEGGREIKGYSETKDHTKQQTEVWAKTTDDHKAFTKVKNGINIYSIWDFNNADGLSKNELIEKNIKAYIDACEEAGYIPKFRDYVMNNGKVLNDVLRYSKELGTVPYNATIEDISFEYKGYTIPYGYYKFLGDFGMFTPDGNASPQQALSLKNYDFAKAVEFFADSETLRRNEVLQQFSNGEERQRYRDSDLTAEQLMEIVKQKRGEIAKNVADGQYSLSMEGEAPSKYGNISGDDVRLQEALTQENIAPIPEDIAKTATTTPTVSKMEQVAPVAEDPKSENIERAYAKIDKQLEQDKVALAEEFEQKKASLREQLKDKNAYISNRAKELYNELSNLKKGVRASNELGYLLDHGFDWNTLKSTLLKVSRWSDKTINPNSVEESTVREMLNEEYDGKLYDLDDIDNEYQERVAELDKRVEKEKGEAQKADQRIKRAELHQRIVDGIKSKFTKKGLDLDDALKKAKDLSTFATVDNTPQRVMEKSLGYKAGQTLADETVNKVAQNETEGIKWLNSYTDRKNGFLAKICKQYNIKPGSKESAAAQIYAEGFYVAENGDLIEYGDFQLAKDFPEAKTQANIKGLASDTRIREIYDETLNAINESRVRNGYPEIPRLDNYYLHFRAMEDTFSRLGLPFNPNDIRAKDLPTDLNGVTADLKPGQPYFASAMHRRGQRTSYDLIGGLERYLSSAKNQIYHIDDIQTFRALRNYIADNYGQAKGLESLDSLTEEEAQERIKQVYDSHLSTFAKFLNEEANILAGKTSLIDRGLEGIIGRRGITFLDTVNKQVGSNMVGFNVSSSLTNFIAPVQAFAKTNKVAFVKGFAQTISNRLASIKGKGDGFAENSPVMIRRQGADRFARTPFQKVADVGYSLMGAVDSISTEIIARAKYNELTAKGMASDQAHIETDKWVSKLMGDRSLGQMPQLYNSKMLGLVTKFQLEVRNQLDSQFYDTIQEAKASNEDIANEQERNAKTAAKVASTFVQLAVAQHIFGQVFESIAGYNPTFDIIEALIKAFGLDDDEEDEDTVLDNIEEGFLTLLEDMPYTSVFMDGGRIPISSALPIGELITGKDEYGNEKSRLETLGEIAPYYVLPGGYGQIKKSVQGLSMFSDDHPIAGSYTDSGNLRFPVEDTFGNRVKAGLFGQWASKNARDYLENERSPLNEKQIKEYADVDLPIAEYWDYREGLSGLNTLAEKADYINSLDIETWQKNLLINNIANRNTNIDLSDYDDYGSFEEFDYAQRSPGMYALSKAVASDYKTFKQYGKDLNNIKSDKNKNGNPVSGSRKKKVIDYINSLEDTEYGERIILYKTQYKSDNTYNADILEYLNSRNDLTYEERVAILKELGFKISSDGKKASW